jgi:hypothetical protein
MGYPLPAPPCGETALVARSRSAVLSVVVRDEKEEVCWYS